MDQEMNFSLSYEQLTQAAEEEIKNCNLGHEGSRYVLDRIKAVNIVRFWYLLALRGHHGITISRLEADWQRLNALVHKKEGEYRDNG